MPSYTFIGAERGDWTGFSVGSAGDYDNDGLDDLVIGAIEYYPSQQGFGKGVGTSIPADPAPPGTGLSWLIAADDLDVLDRLDNVAGTADGVIFLENVAVLHAEKADAQSYRLDGIGIGDATGFSVGSAGDFDGDAFDDIVIGAPFANSAATDAGQIFLISGADLAGAANTDGVIELSTIHTAPGSYSFLGEATGDRAGYSVASGNFQGDASSELVIGAVETSGGGTDAGQVYVFDHAAAEAADTDGDGIVLLSDVVGAAGGYRIDGASGTDHVGSVVANAGDTDGDGLDDLLITTAVEFVNPFPPPEQPPPGYAFLISGGQLAAADALGSVDGVINLDQVPGLPGSYEFYGVTGAVRLAWSASSAGDVDDDGKADILIGASLAGVSTNPGTGIAYLIDSDDFAAFDAADATEDGYINLSLFQHYSGSYALLGEASGDRAGETLAGVGDMDGDGRDDIVIGAFLGGTDDQGQIYAVLARDLEALDAADSFGTDGYIELGYVGTAGFGSFSLVGAAGGDYLGLGLGPAGDVDGDGVAEFLVGAPGNNFNGTDSGVVYLIDPRDFICFAAGTLIDTPAGLRKVEALQIGDLVTTRDHGAQPVRWAGSRAVSAATLRMRPDQCPVLIRADAFGPGRPRHDVRLSPQHRVLLDSRRLARLFGLREALVPAVHLVGLPGVARDTEATDLRYCHLLFDRHEVLSADGLPTESLLHAPGALNALTTAQKAAIARATGGAEPDMRPARRVLTGAEARRYRSRAKACAESA